MYTLEDAKALILKDKGMTKGIEKKDWKILDMILARESDNVYEILVKGTSPIGHSPIAIDWATGGYDEKLDDSTWEFPLCVNKKDGSIMWPDG